MLVCVHHILVCVHQLCTVACMILQLKTACFDKDFNFTCLTLPGMSQFYFKGILFENISRMLAWTFNKMHTMLPSLFTNVKWQVSLPHLL